MLRYARLSVLTLLLAAQAVAQPLELTPDCTVTVGNQTALVRPDGTFLVRNVSIFATFQVGILPQLYRARATCLRDGQMITGQSEFFIMTPGQTTFIADILPTALDPIPVSLSAAASEVIVPRGETVQLAVTASFRDGTTEDVTLRSAGTTYRSSNPRLLQVTEDGLLIGANNETTAQTAVIGIMNEGNLAVVTLTTTGPPADVDNDGLADEWELLFGFSLLTDDSGGDPDGDGLTNLEEFNLGTLPLAADTDLDGIPDNLDNQPLRPDETPPLVVITSPAEGAVLITGDTIFFAVETSDNEGVAAIELSVNGEMVAAGASSPFVFPFTIEAGAESLAFEAFATDLTGNLGTAAVSTTVLVDPLTTVVGRVVDADGDPVAGAAVILSSGDEDQTDAVGGFSIPGAPSLRGDLFADAGASVGGEDLTGTSAVVTPVPGGVTDLGDIEIGVRGSIFPGRIFPTGDRPFDFAIGDVNLDGHLDAVVANANSSDVAVLLGTGNGTFEPATRLPSSGSPWSVELADLNGDGRLDMAVVDRTGASVSVRLGLGGGVFGTPESHSLGADPRIVTAIDVDGDGSLDLAILIRSGASVAVLLGNGDGTFQPPQAYPVTSPSHRRLITADLDGDTFVDFVTLSTADAVSVLRGNGDGTFQAEERYAVGARPFDLAVGDLDQDGDLDLVTSNFSSDDLSVLLNDGSGAFPSELRIVAPGGPRFVVVEDLNLDGIPDLAVGRDTARALSVFLGTGSGGFAPALEISLDGTQASRMVVHDLDKDGAPDLILGGGFILRGTGDGSFTVGQRSLLSLGAVADLDEDGRDDLVGVDGTGDGLVVLLGNGDGTVESASVLTASPRTVWPEIADFDLDGIVDLVVCNRSFQGTVSVFKGLGGGRFGEQQQFSVGVMPISQIVIDVNLDGIPDIITANNARADLSVLIGNGDGTFQPETRIVTALAPWEIVAVDVNLDTLTDVVVANNRGDTISVLLGDPTGGFLPEISIPHSGPAMLALGDLNGDAFPDMAVLAGVRDNVDIFLGKGDGSFTLFQTFFTGESSFAVELADIDLDGNLDLVSGNLDGAEGIVLHPGRGDGTFEPRIAFPVGREFHDVTVADINRDEFPDLLATSAETNDLTLLLGNGDRTFRPAQRFRLNTSVERIAVGDLNGDGKPDVAVTNRVFGGGNTLLVLLQR